MSKLDNELPMKLFNKFMIVALIMLLGCKGKQESTSKDDASAMQEAVSAETVTGNENSNDGTVQYYCI